ncbi:OmpA family protein [bacterium]|jgi:chemotaxis protein MotB|nr:OmpA family protein [bacterium]
MKRNRRIIEDIDNFYISWGDLITLLLVMFIFLYSISTIDQNKFLLVTQSVQEEIMDSPVDTSVSQLVDKMKEEQKRMEETFNQIKKVVREEKLEDVFDVQFVDRSIELRMENVLLFSSGSADLKAIAQNVLGKIGIVLSQSSGIIIVEGHTDDVPIRSTKYPSNWELSSARAASVVRNLSGNGVHEARFRIQAFNKFDPLVPNKNMASRAKNRRVELKILPAEIISEEGSS